MPDSIHIDPTARRGAVVPRSTVAGIVRSRDEALKLFEEAFDAMTSANAVVGKAWAAARRAGNPRVNRYNFATRDDSLNLIAGVKLPEREKWRTHVRRVVDADVWSHLLEITEIDKLMDATAKEQFAAQLSKEPPEVTEDNVYATLQQLVLDADTIFKRGIATCFAKLDRRFKSHDGWKIGSRVILPYCFSETGGWNYGRPERDTMHDIDRTFRVLDGKPVLGAWEGGIVGAVENARDKAGYGRRQAEVESDYFRIRTFKNGNAHVWFKRDDLVREVNKLLGDYYGAAIPEERDVVEDDGGLHSPKTTPARNFGFFPTPEPAALELVGCLPTYRSPDEAKRLPRWRILEPSAGRGDLARRLAMGPHRPVVHCIEIQPDRAAYLRDCGLYERVVCADFLALAPPVDAAELYDFVAMNPPFDRERDIDHVMHALKFLKPTGFLAAIMSAGTEFRETRKSEAFREHVRKLGGQFRDLPAGSFASVGTNVNTCILQVYKNGRSFYAYRR